MLEISVYCRIPLKAPRGSRTLIVEECVGELKRGRTTCVLAGPWPIRFHVEVEAISLRDGLPVRAALSRAFDRV